MKWFVLPDRQIVKAEAEEWVITIIDAAGDIQHLEIHFSKRAAEEKRIKLQKWADKNKYDYKVEIECRTYERAFR
jgi:hypothetical protein